MHCKYCQAQLPENTKTCPVCGRYLGNEFKDTAKKLRKKQLWIGLGIIAIAGIFVLTTFGGNFLSQKNTNQIIEQQVSKVSANNLGMTFKEFQSIFNNSSYTSKIGLKLNDAEFIKGNNENSFQYPLSNHLLIAGLLGKYDNNILEIRLIAQPSNEKEDNIRFITTLGVIIDTFSPDVPANERSKILNELGFNKDTDIYKADTMSVRGNIKYRFKFVDKIGFMFSVTNINRN